MILAFHCSCPITSNRVRPWTHEHTLGVPRNVNDLQSVEFADFLGSIAEDHHLTRCAQVCLAGTEEDQAEPHDQGTIDVKIRTQTNFWMRAQQLTRKLSFWNRCLLWDTQ